MMVERLELVVPSVDGLQKLIYVSSFVISNAPFGGGDGRKYYLDQVRSREKNSSLTRLVGKEYSLPLVGMQDELWLIAKTSSELFKLGYPVPALVGYCGYRAHSLLVMSDMTERGRYLLWGDNDSPHKEEKGQLAQMRLNSRNVEDISDQVHGWATKAVRDGVYIGSYSYHVRKDRSTSLLNIAMLDLYHQQIGNVDTSSNEANAANFIFELQAAIKSLT